jgi:hypothetical protein
MLASRHWLVVLRSCHIIGRNWSEQNCAFGALLRPGQKTCCAIVKVDNGGDGHFRAKAALSCLASFGGFMPDQPFASSNIRKHYRRWHVTNFPKGGMSKCTPGFPTPFAWTYQRSHRHATLRSPCNNTIIAPHLSLIVQVAVIMKKSVDVAMKPFALLGLPSVLSFGLVVVGGFLLKHKKLHRSCALGATPPAKKA